jgi:hypothetical protein
VVVPAVVVSAVVVSEVVLTAVVVGVVVVAAVDVLLVVEGVGAGDGAVDVVGRGDVVVGVDVEEVDTDVRGPVVAVDAEVGREVVSGPAGAGELPFVRSTAASTPPAASSKATTTPATSGDGRRRRRGGGLDAMTCVTASVCAGSCCVGASVSSGGSSDVSARTNASPSRGRAAGPFASAAIAIAASAGGALRRIPVTSGGSASRCIAASSTGVSLSNGNRPDSIR